jgi:hypothetical protein
LSPRLQSARRSTSPTKARTFYRGDERGYTDYLTLPTTITAWRGAWRLDRRRSGRTVVDIWGGFRDTARTTPGTGAKLVNVFVIDQTFTSLAALTFIERGQLGWRWPSP